MMIDYGPTFKKRRNKKHMNAWRDLKNLCHIQLSEGGGAYYVLVNIFITECQSAKH